jgi:predicted dehydrogenase
VNLLIVGCGSIGRKHESNSRRLGANVITVDPDPTVRATLADLEAAILHYPRQYFTHAIIATPVETHLGILETLLEYGVPRILVEKPLATPKELNLVKSFLEQRSCSSKICVGFNWRFNSAVQRMKQMISADEVGAVQVAQLSAREWLPNYGGNVLLESGSHILDTARYLVGELSVLGASITNYGRFGARDEAASNLLRSKEGADVYVHVNFVNSAPYDYRILVQGSKETRECQPDRLEPMHLSELEAFLHDGGDILASIDDGIHNLQLLKEALGK